jgi:starch synthase
MYSLRYGTPPVVRATGGLADTVVPATRRTIAAGTANGFVFQEPTAAALLRAIRDAVSAWRHPVLWKQLQRTGMARDWGWRRSARRYLSLFESLAGAAREAR